MVRTNLAGRKQMRVETAIFKTVAIRALPAPVTGFFQGWKDFGDIAAIIGKSEFVSAARHFTRRAAPGICRGAGEAEPGSGLTVSQPPTIAMVIAMAIAIRGVQPGLGWSGEPDGDCRYFGWLG